MEVEVEAGIEEGVECLLCIFLFLFLFIFYSHFTSTSRVASSSSSGYNIILIPSGPQADVSLESRRPSRSPRDRLATLVD